MDAALALYRSLHFEPSGSCYMGYLVEDHGPAGYAVTTNAELLS